MRVAGGREGLVPEKLVGFPFDSSSENLFSFVFCCACFLFEIFFSCKLIFYNISFFCPGVERKGRESRFLFYFSLPYFW